MKKKNENKQQETYEDNNFSYTDMNVPGMPWYKDPKAKKTQREINSQRLNRKEKRAILRASLLKALPGLIIVVSSFALVAALLWLWIK